MSPPFFTVALATYNRAGSAEAAIRSLADQTFRDVEVVVVDDGSTDDTVARLRALELPSSGASFRLVHRENGGISAARNTGARAARGRYLVFLDDDDRPHPTWLERLHDELVRTGAPFVSCGARFVAPDGVVLEVRRPRPMGRLFGEAAALVLAGTFAIDRELYAEVGGYTEGLQCSHQTDLALRLLPLLGRRGVPVGRVDEPLLDIERRRPDDRPESSPEKLLSGTTYLLTAHATALATAPSARANYEAIAGVAAARLGDASLARSHFLAALRAEPTKAVHWRRAVASVTGPVARRRWRSTARAHATEGRPAPAPGPG